MRKGHIYSGMFMVLFLCGSAALALPAVWQARDEAQAPSPATVIKGEWSESYEGVFNENLASYEPSVNSWGLLNYVLFREGEDGVLIGDNDWLFTKEEFDFYPDPAQQVEKKLEFVAAVRDRLEERNIKLVVAVIPSKARLYEENLGRYAFPSYKENLYKAFTNGLRQKNIIVADILESMTESGDQELFLRTDTHWAPAGARLAAGTIADTVKNRMPDLELEHKSFETRITGKKLYQGDLLRYVPLGDMAALIGPPPDKISVAETMEKETRQSASSTEDALFSEIAPPVTLVGTSYSANPLWNFEGSLKEFLQADVLNAADEGMGPFETMKKYMADESFRKTPPKLIIWEIPERYIPFSYDLKMVPEEEV